MIPAVGDGVWHSQEVPPSDMLARNLWLGAVIWAVSVEAVLVAVSASSAVRPR